MGPHGIGNRWSSAGTSGHDGCARFAGHVAFTATTSDLETGSGPVQVPHPGCREPSGLLATMRWSPRTGLTVRSGWSQRRNRIPGHPRRLCHYRAIHSGHDRSSGDNHGQCRSSFDLRGFTPLQVTIAADLALGAGSRIVYSCFRRFGPCGWRVLLDAVLRSRVRFRPRRLRCRRDGIRRA
jgi:hypothetical protein